MLGCSLVRVRPETGWQVQVQRSRLSFHRLVFLPSVHPEVGWCLCVKYYDRSPLSPASVASSRGKGGWLRLSAHTSSESTSDMKERELQGGEAERLRAGEAAAPRRAARGRRLNLEHCDRLDELKDNI